MLNRQVSGVVSCHFSFLAEYEIVQVYLPFMIFKYIQIAGSLAKPGPHLCWQTQAMATWWTPGRDITSGTVWHCAQSSKLYIQVLSIPLAIPLLPRFESFSSESWSSINWWITLGPCLALAVSICIMIMLSCPAQWCTIPRNVSRGWPRGFSCWRQWFLSPRSSNRLEPPDPFQKHYKFK